MSNDLVSVVIPVYNRFELLKPTIDSVLIQTYKNLEIILVDDGSLVPLDKSYIPEDPRITIIRLHKNYGAQHARNEGIKRAEGKWIALLDSDDQWLANKIKIQLKGLQDSEYLIAACDGDINYEGGSSHLNLTKNFSSGDISDQILLSPSLMLQGTIIAKECFEAIDYLDEKVPAFHEWDTMIRLSQRFPFLIQSDSLFIYHSHKLASITKDLVLRKEGYKYIIEKHKLQHKDHINYLNNISDSWQSMIVK